jgi:hypothetical protein
MKFAHFYKARGGKFTLIISTGPSIVGGEEHSVSGKAEARKLAKQLGATPHNF